MLWLLNPVGVARVSIVIVQGLYLAVAGVSLEGRTGSVYDDTTL